jgi:hypothetical protein
MIAQTNLNENYSSDTDNDISLNISVGDGQIGAIDIYVDGNLRASGGDTLSYNFGRGSDMIGKTISTHVVASQPDPGKTLTNVHYVFNGGPNGPKAFDNTQLLANGDTSTIFTDQFNLN